jgi:hypothetical protein
MFKQARRGPARQDLGKGTAETSLEQRFSYARKATAYYGRVDSHATAWWPWALDQPKRVAKPDFVSVARLLVNSLLSLRVALVPTYGGLYRFRQSEEDNEAVPAEASRECRVGDLLEALVYEVPVVGNRENVRPMSTNRMFRC